MAIILLIETEDGEVTELPILERMVIGRSSTSDLKINDAKMSGSHCSFEINNRGQLLLKDLGSTNGSFLNDLKVKQASILIGDVVKIGNTLIRIDSKKLNENERKALGSPETRIISDKTRSHLTTTKSELKEATRKRIVLGKNPKEKKLIPNWSKKGPGDIEPEASSGKTKMLQLDAAKKKKKP